MDKKYDERGNEIYYKYPDGYTVWKEYDENNNLIYYKNSFGNEYWYKWENDEQIEITQKEFEQIKRRKNRRLINNSRISRFEIMDI